MSGPAVGLVLVALLSLTFASSAWADNINQIEDPWTIYENSPSNYFSFTVTYGGLQEFRWVSDTPHSSQVRIQRCDGTILSDYIDSIAAHDTAYHGFIRGGNLVVVGSGACVIARAFSNFGTQSNLHGHEAQY